MSEVDAWPPDWCPVGEQPPPPRPSLPFPFLALLPRLKAKSPRLRSNTRTRERIRVLEVRRCDSESLKLSLGVTKIGMTFERSFWATEF